MSIPFPEPKSGIGKTLNALNPSSLTPSMASQILLRTRSLFPKHPSLLKTITTFPSLSQEPQLADPTPLPPNPATGSPLYHQNWRNPIPSATASAASNALAPLGSHRRDDSDSRSLLDTFANSIASQDWAQVRDHFQAWVHSLDKHGKPNSPDVGLFNHYLRANLMLGASAADLLDILAQMPQFGVAPNTASYNLVLKAMCQANETLAADKLLQRFDRLQTLPSFIIN